MKQVVAWNNEANLLVFGGGIAVMIAALTPSWVQEKVGIVDR